MRDNSQSSGGGIGLCTAMFLVFLVLKLCNVIAWSWLWVTAPLWIPFGIVMGCALLVAIIAAITPSRTRKW